MFAATAAGEQLHCQCGESIRVPDPVRHPETKPSSKLVSATELGEKRLEEPAASALRLTEVKSLVAGECEVEESLAEPAASALRLTEAECEVEESLAEPAASALRLTEVECEVEESLAEPAASVLRLTGADSLERDLSLIVTQPSRMDPDLVFQEFREPPGRAPIVWQPPAESNTESSLDVSHSNTSRAVALSNHSSSPLTAPQRSRHLLGRLSIIASVTGLLLAIAIAIAMYRVDGNYASSFGSSVPLGKAQPAIPIAPRPGAETSGVAEAWKSEAPLATSQTDETQINERRSNERRSAEPQPTEAGAAGGRSEFLTPIETLATKLLKQDSLQRQQLREFANEINQLGDRQQEFQVADLFWIADTWQQLAERAEDSESEGNCYWLAAAAYALAQSLDGIAGHEREIAAAQQKDLSAKAWERQQVAAKSNESPERR
ncbi:MAG: hypothetical protein AAFV88_01755 [Planctomycetota bacterium]